MSLRFGLGLRSSAPRGAGYPASSKGPSPQNCMVTAIPFFPSFLCHATAPHTLSLPRLHLLNVASLLYSAQLLGVVSGLGATPGSIQSVAPSFMFGGGAPMVLKVGVYAVLGNPAQASCMPCMCFFLGAISPAHPCSSIQPESWGSFLIT